MNPLFLTLISAFFGAVTAQLLSHFLTVKRDNKKTFLEKYQTLYSKVLPSLSVYMNIQRNPRALHDLYHDVSPEKLFNESLNFFQENLKYSNSKILHVYEKLIGNEYYEDGWGSKKEFYQSALIYFFLLNWLKESKKTSIYKKGDRVRLKNLSFYYGLNSICMLILDPEEVTSVLRMEEWLGPKYYRNNIASRIRRYKINRRITKVILSERIDIARKLVKLYLKPAVEDPGYFDLLEKLNGYKQHPHP
ncbi:hypothetical protein [Sporosarcina sp. Marseille-Q4943]|uniref:hypothetical protein n=1 Tax=Sporosarcina sp. Marseille-Q4943 TaxID=2942204 RepID=UPI00208DA554|nr:hypothetical protein [Sporosarcina sp. Marseille-Q4943]